MISKKLSIYSFVSVAAIVSSVVAGCGGSGSSGVSGVSNSVTTTGGTTTTTQTFTTGVSTSAVPQSVSVTVNGQVVNASLPAGLSIPAGTSVSVIPPTAIINGLSHPKYMRHGAPTTGTPYEIRINGRDSGVAINADGTLTGYLVLPLSNTLYNLTVSGQFTLAGKSGNLTINNSVGLGFYVTVDSFTNLLHCGLPAGLLLRVPVDGSKFTAESTAVAYLDSYFATQSLHLSLDAASSNLHISQSGTVASVASGPFSGYTSYTFKPNAAIGKLIPSGGIDSLTISQ